MLLFILVLLTAVMGQEVIPSGLGGALRHSEGENFEHFEAKLQHEKQALAQEDHDLEQNNTTETPVRMSPASTFHARHEDKEAEANIVGIEIGGAIIFVFGIILLSVVALVLYRKQKRRQENEEERQTLKELLEADMDYAAM